MKDQHLFSFLQSEHQQDFSLRLTTSAIPKFLHNPIIYHGLLALTAKS